MRPLLLNSFWILLLSLFAFNTSFSQNAYAKREIRGHFKIQNQPRKEAYSNREPTESKVVSRDYLKIEVQFGWFGKLRFHETNSYTNLDLKYTGKWKLEGNELLLEYSRLEESIALRLDIINKDAFKQKKEGKEYLRITKK